MMVFGTFGIHWVMLGSVLDLLFGWWNWLGKQGSDIWNLVPLCLMWTVWKERNRRTFENMELSRDALANIFFVLFLIGLGDGGLLIVFPFQIF